MALFNFKKKAAAKETKVPRASAAKKPAAVVENVLVRPHVTEKATFAAERSAYVFVVTPEATKASVTASVARVYGVTPRRVNIVNLPSKRTATRGRLGRKPGLKKAYVYLPEGSTISLA